MPLSGKLGVPVDLAANADTAIYTCSAPAVAATATVSLCNRNNQAVKVRIAVSAAAAGAPAAADYLEFDAQVAANGVLERTGIATSIGEKIFVRSDVAGVSARAHGFEK